jgi:hypothetical protein
MVEVAALAPRATDSGAVGWVERSETPHSGKT